MVMRSAGTKRLVASTLRIGSQEMSRHGKFVFEFPGTFQGKWSLDRHIREIPGDLHELRGREIDDTAVGIEISGSKKFHNEFLKIRARLLYVPVGTHALTIQLHVTYFSVQDWCRIDSSSGGCLKKEAHVFKQDPRRKLFSCVKTVII